MIVNPHGGIKQGREILKQIMPVFDRAGIKLQILETESQGHARTMAEALDLTGIDGLCAIGGDGTLHEIVNGMLARPEQERIPIGMIPGGSGNSFMLTLEMGDPLEAARSIVKGGSRPIDVAHVQLSDQSFYACNIVGWGLVTDIGIRSEQFRWAGTSRYTIASIIEVLIGRRRRARLVVNGQVMEEEFSFVLALNTRHTGKGMLMAPRASLSDGLIDLVIVPRAPRLKILRLLPKVFDGSHIDSPLLDYRQVSSFELYPAADDPLNIDGELRGSGAVKLKMIPGGFELLN